MLSGQMKQEIGSGGDQGEREQGDSPLLEREEEEDGGEREREREERTSGQLVHLMQTCCHRPYARCQRATSRTAVRVV